MKDKIIGVRLTGLEFSKLELLAGISQRSKSDVVRFLLRQASIGRAGDITLDGDRQVNSCVPSNGARLLDFVIPDNREDGRPPGIPEAIQVVRARLSALQAGHIETAESIRSHMSEEEIPDGQLIGLPDLEGLGVQWGWEALQADLYRRLIGILDGIGFP